MTMGQMDQMDSSLTSPEVERACQQFLFREAELLDGNDFTRWVETCLSKDLNYRIPIRTTRERHSGISEFSEIGFHMQETHASMQVRVKRLLTEQAWAEDPPSRTRRLVSNVRVRELAANMVEVKSYLMLYRSQGETADYDLLVAERQDTLRLEQGEWHLLRRSVLLDHTILPTPNLGIFL